MTMLVYDSTKENKSYIASQLIYGSLHVRVNIVGRIFFRYQDRWFTVGDLFYESEAKYKLPRDTLEEIGYVTYMLYHNTTQK